ncbi:conserved hypothetical protein [Treponema phagedenis]|uniref:Uncharacterized protein n=1 Tax=Treponema phagedenis TaxID=162 RepID=A0A0B7GWW3_TREPH|nr:hypothetical protein HMPREF9554_00880 [Treponema phagedenis F0421]CEM62047.1 conserved hypothetical protein [Treponema phagedenis]
MHLRKVINGIPDEVLIEGRETIIKNAKWKSFSYFKVHKKNC